MGDYYDNGKKILCHSCYEQVGLSHDHVPLSARSERSSGKGTHHGYHKVRDCRSIHKHEFPGKEPKIIVSQ